MIFDIKININEKLESICCILISYELPCSTFGYLYSLEVVIGIEWWNNKRRIRFTRILQFKKWCCKLHNKKSFNLFFIARISGHVFFVNIHWKNCLFWEIDWIFCCTSCNKLDCINFHISRKFLIINAILSI